jgi:hypothetical protein|tara:strand:- start:299 stop:1270 length:972 start_codon:yes stop_codon:yes gene_type:complete
VSLKIYNWEVDVLKFIIWTPVYRDNSGGIIVLHKLASMLREAGHVALIWPQPKPSVVELKALRGWVKLAKWFKILLKNLAKNRDIKSPYKLDIARNKDIEGAVVVYPEITAGNPLGGSFVIRWLLNKPGVISGMADFGSKDLFFYYHKHFNDWVINPHEDHHLNISELKSNVYQNTNNPERSGQCYMVRKGRDRDLDYHEVGAQNVDGLSHEELAKIFNKCEYFICYDLYTMYCRYAAMCGCIPIVVPKDGLSKEEWRPEIENRYGIAYGWDDVSWAVETRSNLFDYLAEAESRGVDSVDRFVTIVERYFSDQLNTKPADYQR